MLQLETALVPHKVAENLHLKRPRKEEAHYEPLLQLVGYVEQENKERPFRYIAYVLMEINSVDNVFDDEVVAYLAEHDY